MVRQILLISGLALAGLLGSALIFRGVRLQRDVQELQVQARQTNAQLGEMLQAQRMALAASGDIGRQVRGLAELAPGVPPAPASAPKGKEVGAPTEQSSPAPPSPEVVEKVEKVRMMVDSAIAAGHWTQENRHELHSLMVIAPMSEVQPLIVRVITAMNDKKLASDVMGPPF